MVDFKYKSSSILPYISLIGHPCEIRVFLPCSKSVLMSNRTHQSCETAGFSDKKETWCETANVEDKVSLCKHYSYMASLKWKSEKLMWYFFKRLGPSSLSSLLCAVEVKVSRMRLASGWVTSGVVTKVLTQPSFGWGVKLWVPSACWKESLWPFEGWHVKHELTYLN